MAVFLFAQSRCYIDKQSIERVPSIRLIRRIKVFQDLSETSECPMLECILEAVLDEVRYIAAGVVYEDKELRCTVMNV